jgi:hypothetical protein
MMSRTLTVLALAVLAILALTLQAPLPPAASGQLATSGLSHEIIEPEHLSHAILSGDQTPEKLNPRQAVLTDAPAHGRRLFAAGV